MLNSYHRAHTRGGLLLPFPRWSMLPRRWRQTCTGAALVVFQNLSTGTMTCYWQPSTSIIALTFPKLLRIGSANTYFPRPVIASKTRMPFFGTPKDKSFASSSLPGDTAPNKSRVFTNIAPSKSFPTNCGDSMTDVARRKNEAASDEMLDMVLDQVARYRMTVAAAVSRLPMFSAFRPREIRNLLKECRRRSLLDSAPLCQAKTYWHLTVEGAQRCGLPEERMGPLSEAAKIRAYAILLFCCLSEKPRHRLTNPDLERHFPELYRPGLPQGYFFDPEGQGRLGLLRIDAGQRGRWDRVVESLREDITNHFHEPGFRRLIQANRFEITLLTVFEEKARRIYETLAKFRDAHRVPVKVVSFPELLPLITSTPRKEVARSNTA